MERQTEVIANAIEDVIRFNDPHHRTGNGEEQRLVEDNKKQIVEAAGLINNTIELRAIGILQRG